jgi:hypothetical protein
MISFQDLKNRLKANRNDQIEIIDLKSKANWKNGFPEVLSGIPRLMRTNIVMKVLFTSAGTPKNNVQSARIMIAEDYNGLSQNQGLNMNDPAITAKLAEMGYIKKDTNPLSQNTDEPLTEDEARAAFEKLQAAGVISKNAKFNSPENPE